jgi:hypothetical protein
LFANIAPLSYPDLRLLAGRSDPQQRAGLREIAVRLEKSFSVEMLRADLDRVGNDFWAPVIEEHAGKNWVGAALRSRDGSPVTLDVGESYRDTPLLASLPYMGEVLGFFECSLQRARLLALLPGAAIGEHTDDEDTEHKREVRLHIPVVTNDKAEFYVSGTSIPMNPGQLWYVDVSMPHKVHNFGGSARVHVVIDCLVNNWLMERLKAPAQRICVDLAEQAIPTNATIG